MLFKQWSYNNFENDHAAMGVGLPGFRNLIFSSSGGKVVLFVLDEILPLLPPPPWRKPTIACLEKIAPAPMHAAISKRNYDTRCV